jgi:hypothetical protein
VAPRYFQWVKIHEGEKKEAGPAKEKYIRYPFFAEKTHHV